MKPGNPEAQMFGQCAASLFPMASLTSTSLNTLTGDAEKTVMAEVLENPDVNILISHPKRSNTISPNDSANRIDGNVKRMFLTTRNITNIPHLGTGGYTPATGRTRPR